MSNDRIEQAIAAYEADEHKEAASLLAQVVKEDKTNDRAWYYLGLVQKDPTKRQQCFERALRFNPNNDLASEALAEMQADDTSAQSVASTPDNVTPMPAEKARSVEDQSVGIGFLSGIPGAPQSLSVGDVTQQGQALAEIGVPTLAQQTDDTPGALSTWWQVVLSVGLVSLVIGIINVIASLIRIFRFEATPDLIGVIFSPIITLVLGCIAVGAGSFLSYWYMKQNGGTGELLPHSADVVSIWIPISVLLAIVGLVEVLVLPLIDQARGGSVTLEQILYNGFPTLSGGMLLFTLISAALVGYGIFLIQKLLVKRHGVPGQLAWAGALIMAIITALVF